MLHSFVCAVDSIVIRTWQQTCERFMGSLVDGVWPNVEHLFPSSAVDEIADLAAAADRDGQMSDKGLEVLRRIGWLGLAVPKKFGGLGAGLRECLAVQRKLGAADPGLAIACAMHLGSIGVWVEHYARQADMTWTFMEAVATQGLIVASAMAEPNLGGSVNRSTLRAKRISTGWEVSGRKSPLSFASCADLITLQFQSEATADEPSKLLAALIPRKLPGISAKSTWDTMGMRGAGADTLILDRCVIPDPLVVYQGLPGESQYDDMAAGIIWSCLVLTTTYLGVVEAALAITRDLLGRVRIEHLDTSRLELPSFQSAVGQQISALLTLELACSALAMSMERKESPEQFLAPALAIKQHAVEVIPELLGVFVESCGGIAYTRLSPLERFWRDAQAIRFHPPTPRPVAQFLGRRALGVTAILDLDEVSPLLRSQRL
jgi:alkylation response protein AidB-like acyl-CoA dehydrogenase